jgi:hypothetical protein
MGRFTIGKGRPDKRTGMVNACVGAWLPGAACRWRGVVTQPVGNAAVFLSHQVLFRIGDLPTKLFAEQASKFVTFGHKLLLRASISPVFVIVYPVEQTCAKRG